MTKLVWDKVLERPFETGVDRGVLYYGEAGSDDVPPGVAWNGLIRVVETPVVTGTPDYYMDGIKYQRGQTVESFSGVLEAYTYPDEFVEGLLFGLSYRTTVGLYDYKIHLYYDLRASLPEQNYQTIGSSNDPLTFTWNLASIPVNIRKLKPVSTVVIDSRKTPKTLMAELEEILYGTDTTPPRIPYPAELLNMFDVWVAGYGHGPYGHNAYGGN